MGKALCLIGSSHLATIKMAWDELAGKFSDVSVDFFGSNQSAMNSIKQFIVDGDYLRPDSRRAQEQFAELSGGQKQINFSKYDAFVVVGLEISFLHALYIFRQFQIFPLKEGNKRKNTLISYDCLKRTLRDIYTRSSGVQVLKALRGVSQRPIFMLPVPYLAAEGVESERYGFINDLSEEGIQLIHTAYEEVLEKICQDYSLTLVKQDPRTVTRNCFTRDEYARNAPLNLVSLVREDAASSVKNDFVHMNKNFGLMVFPEILEKVQAA